MRVAGADELRQIDRSCVEDYGIPMIVLMENAALKLLKHCLDMADNDYVIVAGCGNNGGDGLALARHLHSIGKKVKVFFVGNIEKASECFNVNYNILMKLNIKIQNVEREEDLEKLQMSVETAQLVIDGIFGTGLNREVTGLFSEIIKTINLKASKVLCIDIPSGMKCDDGQIMNCCIKASRTISFEMSKLCFLTYDAQEFCGEVVVEPIGICEEIIHKYHRGIFITEKSILKEHIKRRNLISHKGDYGRAMIVGGSPGLYGALYIAVSAAVRAGSGLVTAASFSYVISEVSSRFVEAMTVDVNSERFSSVLEKSDCIGVGPGLGKSMQSKQLLERLIKNCNCPIVIDADGLNLIAENDAIRKLVYKANQKIIMTPHVGEMARLTGYTAEYINNNRIQVAKDYAEKEKVILLLKGYNTVITDGSLVYVNPTGSSAMASGGMGDCLTGIITSFISQGIEPYWAAVCAAYVHGYCGDNLSDARHSVCASDIIEKIPFALKEILYI
ncbi:NAD(P)H-hydrate dehydratase [Clostridium oryzae]|uniref:Bifunctional NAD(P)H-hydrate repair enzyme n=1 Tax=Clostridium oryzae TaxID=1450648 RepID=A0A1V4IYW8_9CLOT|nr:NAD(P)H-hydrate dehydratase [Clostridium oryzae]OPJ65099.1 bifunctional NAD(P)H-hydrate repair enzyme Nnr [Clostridium oryzae]